MGHGESDENMLPVDDGRMNGSWKRQVITTSMEVDTLGMKVYQECGGLKKKNNFFDIHDESDGLQKKLLHDGADDHK